MKSTTPKLLWRVDTVGVAHEAYSVEADTEDDARALILRGEFLHLILSETDDIEIVSVKHA